MIVFTMGILYSGICVPITFARLVVILRIFKSNIKSHSVQYFEYDSIICNSFNFLNSKLFFFGSDRLLLLSFHQNLYANAMGEEAAYQNQVVLYLAASASAEFFADIALCPMEAVKVN